MKSRKTPSNLGGIRPFKSKFERMLLIELLVIGLKVIFMSMSYYSFQLVSFGAHVSILVKIKLQTCLFSINLTSYLEYMLVVSFFGGLVLISYHHIHELSPFTMG